MIITWVVKQTRKRQSWIQKQESLWNQSSSPTLQVQRLSCSIFPFIISENRNISNRYMTWHGQSFSSFSRRSSLGWKRNVLSWFLPFSDNFFSAISQKFSLWGNLSFPKTPDEYFPLSPSTCHQHCWKPNLKRLKDKLGQDDQLRLDVVQLCKTLMVRLCHEKMTN